MFLKIKDEGGNWNSIAAIKGDKGDKGDTGPKGDKGDNGADGHTPVKGVDYFTEADKQELVTAVIAALPSTEEVSY